MKNILRSSLVLAAVGFSTVAFAAGSAVKPVADLSIVKTGPATVEKGTELVYTLSVTNNGPDSLTPTNVPKKINVSFGRHSTNLVFIPQKIGRASCRERV